MSGEVLSLELKRVGKSLFMGSHKSRKLLMETQTLVSCSFPISRV